MRVPRRAMRVGAVMGVAAGLVAGAGPAAGADTAAGQFVHVVKDQAGGAYYNVVSGERFDVTATSIATSLGGFGVQSATGVVLTDLGQVLIPFNDATGSTPAAEVVLAVEGAALGTYQDAADGTIYAIKTVGATVPVGNELAIKLATGVILTINNKVLVPVQKATGLSR